MNELTRRELLEMVGGGCAVEWHRNLGHGRGR